MISELMWVDARPVALHATLPVHGLPLRTPNGVSGYESPGMGLLQPQRLSVLTGMVTTIPAGGTAAQQVAFVGGWPVQAPERTQNPGTRVSTTAPRRSLRPTGKSLSAEFAVIVNNFNNATVFNGRPGFQSWSPPV
ncbi:hypothetical protein LI90_966 [Carbonactinospora thermoautotrophica]|uniref:Uncharacterized protein n=1 Tax=Carbonactinospora thermoautotrophica TaxID=1469144 RepID=A0A132MNA5_9ACTN|nr:hypothetical protein [Carbonactinospora thermoautotrophica]KWW99332.1 hypothetical protein LI90_966 [Carbonactinospora thermoautotrophica]